MAHSGAPADLSLPQRAAIRLLLRGHGSVRVARYLHLNRHTIARWKRDPAFVAELERLSQLLNEAALRIRPNSQFAQYLNYIGPGPNRPA